MVVDNSGDAGRQSSIAFPGDLLIGCGVKMRSTIPHFYPSSSLGNQLSGSFYVIQKIGKNRRFFLKFIWW